MVSFEGYVIVMLFSLFIITVAFFEYVGVIYRRIVILLPLSSMISYFVSPLSMPLLKSTRFKNSFLLSDFHHPLMSNA